MRDLSGDLATVFALFGVFKKCSPFVQIVQPVLIVRIVRNLL